MFIWGLQDTFKSWAVMDLAWSVANGGVWMVFPTNQHSVLLINTELPKPLFQDRMRQTAKVRGTVPPNLHVVTDLNLKLDTEIGMAMLVSWVQQCKPGLIIIDNLYRCFVGDMNKGENVNKLLDTISYIREQYHCAIVFVHHSRKRLYDTIARSMVQQGIEDMTGSKYLANNAATVFEIRTVHIEGVKNAIKLIPEKMWFERNKPPPMTFSVDHMAQFHLA